VGFYVDEELGFQKAPSSVERGHSERKVLFLKVFDELEIFVLLFSSPLENQTSLEEQPGLMQIMSTCSLKILYETKVQADRLHHPENPGLNLNKDERTWESVTHTYS
jgi:hypothetical protein